MSGLKSILRKRIKRHPLLFQAYGKMREGGPYSRRVVRQYDDIVIEGYPRSGNTFATEAFQYAQSNSMNVGNHFHAPAQFFLAGRWGIPAVLLVREPKDVVLSNLVYSPGVSPQAIIKDYIAFHLSVVGILDRVIVSDFWYTTNQFGSVVTFVNEVYKTAFEIPILDEAGNRQIFERIALKRKRIVEFENADSEHRMTLPSKMKDKLKEDRVGELSEPGLQVLLDKASDVYRHILRSAPMRMNE